MNTLDGDEPRLTPRQREILERIAAGKTNTEIADDLEIGFETVKMHVSHLFAELGVSSREEAAEWWKRRHRPRHRMQRILTGGLGLKLLAGSALAAGVGGLAVVAVAMNGSGGGGDGELAAAQESPTAGGVQASSSPEATSTPKVSIGYQAAAALLRFELLDFKADAIHTEITVRVTGDMTESGYPVLWVIDAEGTRVQLQGGDASQAVWRVSGDPISYEPGTVTIEVTPARANVAPPLRADEPTPVWVTFPIPFSGYTSQSVELPIPAGGTQAFGAATAEIQQILVSENRVRLAVRFEGLEKNPPSRGIDFRDILFTVAGDPITPHSGGGGSSGANGTSVLYLEFDRIAGPLIVHLRALPPRECKNPTPIPNGGRVCTDPPVPPANRTLDEYRKYDGPKAEFQITIP